MAIWALILGTAAGLALGGPLGALAGAAVARGATAVATARRPESERRQVAFTVAAIALAAKMARADGFVSTGEFQAFQRLFQVPEKERANAERFWKLAQRSTDGWYVYGKQAADLLGPGSGVLEDLLEALLAIATVDGVHSRELAMLDELARVFGFLPADWARIRARHVEGGADDPHAVLGVTPGAATDQVKAAYRALVKRHHPDRHVAEGLPAEFIRVAETRMAAINAAYAALTRAPQTAGA